MSLCKTYQNDILFDAFEKSNQITVYNNGTQLPFNNDSTQYRQILNAFQDTIKDAFEMPAFGVSLHNETIKAITKGIWLEFNFSEKQEHNGMTFETLLVEISPEYSGFNVIRKFNGLYEGRCFYLNLSNKNMQKIYDTINQVIQN